MYKAPFDEIVFMLKHVAGLSDVLESGKFGDLTEYLVDAVLAEGSRFASDEIAPLAKVGDSVGAKFADGEVVTPPGWADLYTRWREAGWNAATGPEAFGGQGLPTMLGMACQEMWNGASMAFGLGPMLTMGAVEALAAHGSDALKARYLEKLVSGEWMGTMNLTEPEAGSDVGALKTRAERVGDGSYRIFGQKIYITYGEHDWTENIVHLVLARLPDAPAGTRGISLFLVPKFIPNAEGKPDQRNDLICASIEHKLGIHGSPTCTMIYGDKGSGAVGWLIGEENKGMACMFTMMNNARLAVGIQGVAVAEAATQKAMSFANERRQGRAEGFSAGKAMTPIVWHPDVQRMLLTMQALTSAARAIAYACAHAIDMGHVAASAEDRAFWQNRANLLTPVAKAFSTDIGCEVASIGVQVHGGMGFVEETGAAVLMRDARIAPIYEGTNGIQAIDLVIRKLPLDDGKHVHRYIGELREMVESLRTSNLPGLGHAADRLSASLDDLAQATTALQAMLNDSRQNAALAGATPYLRLFGIAVGGAYAAKAAVTPASAQRAAQCRFFAENISPETAALKAIAIDGGESLAAAAEALVAA